MDKPSSEARTRETPTGRLPSEVICGIDEAGRGALAGPLVAAAVTLPVSARTVSRRAGFTLRDGKRLTPAQRIKFVTVIKRLHAGITVEVISARSINNHGIGWANREIMRRLIKRTDADRYVLDGNLKIGRIAGKTGKIASIPHADATVTEVICAGIVAKVERDRIMGDLHRTYFRYGWNRNRGYGTRAHIIAITEFSSTRYHRSVFVTTALRTSLAEGAARGIVGRAVETASRR